MGNLINTQKEKRTQSILGSFGDTLIDGIVDILKNPVLEKAHEISLESGVGIVFNEKNELLLGLAIADDERDGKWTFPGGGIDDKENCLSAAIRETYEETGLVSVPISNMIFIHPAKPMVGFCLLRVKSEHEIVPNKEFKELKWVSLTGLPVDLLVLNREILSIINTKL